MFDISGKTACVTGASSGIGAATAEALAEAGCNLVISARREEKIKDVELEKQSLFPRICSMEGC